MNKPVISTDDSLKDLRTDYNELMQKLQSRQRSLRSNFLQNLGTSPTKRTRRKILQSPLAKHRKIRDEIQSKPTRSSSGHQKTSTPYKNNSRLDHMNITDRKTPTRLSSRKSVSSSLKRKNTDAIGSSHQNSIQNDDFIISPNRRPKRPYPTPLRTGNNSDRSFSQLQQTSTPKSILKSRTSQSKNITSDLDSPLHELENIKHRKLSHRPHFHSNALQSDYYEEVKRRRQSKDIMNDLYVKQLDHTGNNRPKPVQTKDLTAIPKSILMPSRKTRRTPNRVSFRLQDTTPNQSLVDQSGKVQPLLGYDWIAGLLDAEDTISEKSDSYFEELKDFRRVNKEDCIYRRTDERSQSSLTLGLATPTITHPTDTHQCLHNFTLNDRLFVVPVHSNDQGESTCPICHESRKAEIKRESPSFIRVSIPRSTLRSPYKLRPHRRRSFDATDTLGLSQHCLAGWENSRPSMLPMATNVDLKDALRPRVLKEGTVGNESLYKSSKQLPLVPTERTQTLLNRSRLIQLQLNRMKNKHAQ